MTAPQASPTLRAAVAVMGILVLAWDFGGQRALGRIDPALAVPTMIAPALFLAWLMRRDSGRARWRTGALAAVLLVAIQALLALILSARSPWLQLGLVAIAWLAALVCADRLLQWQRGRAVTLPLAFVLAVGWFAGSHHGLALLYRAPAAHGPPATMMTGLPLRWSGTTDLAEMLVRGANEDPALAGIEAAGPLRLVDSLIDHPPRRGGALLLAHPRALAPRELVTIDTFVRGGGRAVILADALTAWPMRYPLGDPRNPPVTSLLTPLLDHWGLTLAAVSGTERRRIPVEVDGSRLTLFSAGRFAPLPRACRSYSGGHVVHCRIGRGEAWLVGDADLLAPALWQPAPPWATHLRRADTIEWLAQGLWPDAPRAALQPLWLRPSAG